MELSKAQTVGVAAAPTPAQQLEILKLDPWSALLAVAVSPDKFILIERNGELYIEPAPTLQ